MSDQKLRKKLIRLAYQKPELRKDLMPILKESATVMPTVSGFLTLLESRFTRYDMKRSTKRGYNPYALAQYLMAVDKVRDRIPSQYLDRDDPEAMEMLKQAMLWKWRDISSAITPVRQVWKMIDAWVEQGKKPKF